MKTGLENIKNVESEIRDLELYQNNKGGIDIDKIKELEEKIDNINCIGNSTEYLLRTKLLKIKERSLNGIDKKITKWDMFLTDILEMDGLDDVKLLALLIDENKDESIPQEEIEKIEELYANILPILHTKLSQYDRDRAIKEFNKKIKLFTNRLSRVIEDDFGAWIKQLRLQKGYSLKELESISGVTASYIHRIENGSRKTPSVPIAERLAIGLGVSPDQFLKKLNIGTTGTPISSELPLPQALAVTPFIINGEKASVPQKNAIIKLMSKILDIKWTNNTKVAESIEVMSLIDDLKKVLPNNN